MEAVDCGLWHCGYLVPFSLLLYSRVHIIVRYCIVTKERP